MGWAWALFDKHENFVMGMSIGEISANEDERESDETYFVIWREVWVGIARDVLIVGLPQLRGH